MPKNDNPQALRFLASMAKHGEQAAAQLAQYTANFARTGDPNGEGLPEWKRASKGRARVLRIAPEGTAMGRADYVKMTRNLLIKGEPKA